MVEKSALIQQSSNDIFHHVNRNIEQFRSGRNSGGRPVGSPSAQSMASWDQAALGRVRGSSGYLQGWRFRNRKAFSTFSCLGACVTVSDSNSLQRKNQIQRLKNVLEKKSCL